MTIKRSTISRRRALAGVATAGVSVPLLAACGDDSSKSSSTKTDTPSANTETSSTAGPSSTPTKTGPTEESETVSAPAADGIPTSDVPVGGGIVVADEEVVITQPNEGEFKAFSSICTHMGCPVTSVEDGFIACPCHGSRFAIETGEPTSDSLAAAPLAAVELTISSGRIILG